MAKYMLMFCSKHGDTNHRADKTKERKSGIRWTCIKCYSERMNKYRRNAKLKAISHLGGKCKRCGEDFSMYPQVFEFHHKDPSKKDFGISKSGMLRKWDVLKKELDKCELYCANCHRMVHADMLQPGSTF